MKDRTNDILISGNNLELTEAIKQMVIVKVSKLFDHEPQIMRIRVDLGMTLAAHNQREFSARGILEIRGKDLLVNVRDEDLYKCIDLLERKLDRMLRRRSRLRVLKRKQPHPVDIPAALPKVQSA